MTGPEQIRKPEEALPLALRAVELEPANANWINTLGVVYYRLGRFDEAVETLNRSIATDEDGGSAIDFFFLAMSYHQLGQPDKAQENYDKAVEWWDANKPLSTMHEKELIAFRAEADVLIGRTDNTQVAEEGGRHTRSSIAN